MTVLSLFDGIASGMIALERAGINVDFYFASEIDETSILIAKNNYPNIIEIGNVLNITYKDGMLFTEKGNFFVGHINLLIGGSPCTNFSSIGYSAGMKSGESEILSLEQYLDLKNKNIKFDGESYLFWEYARILKVVKPDYFLLENVIMAKKWENVITGELRNTLLKNILASTNIKKSINEVRNFHPIKINSSCLSAQNRPRIYWTNIPSVKIPNDKKILLKDILDNNADKNDVSNCQTVKKSFETLILKYGYLPKKFNPYNAQIIKNKAPALTTGSMITSSCATLLFVKVKTGVHNVNNFIMDNKYPVKLKNGKYNLRKLSISEMERLQTLPENYTSIPNLSYSKRSMAIGNGWTVDVITHIFLSLKNE